MTGALMRTTVGASTVTNGCTSGPRSACAAMVTRRVATTIEGPRMARTISAGGGSDGRERQREPEARAALTVGARPGADAASVRFDDGARDREPEAAAALGASGLGLR